MHRFRIMRIYVFLIMALLALTAIYVAYLRTQPDAP
jgi:hypothetical protein